MSTLSTEINAELTQTFLTHLHSISKDDKTRKTNILKATEEAKEHEQHVHLKQQTG